MKNLRITGGRPKRGYAHQLISKGLVFARMAGSTHLTSRSSPPAARFRTTDFGAAPASGAFSVSTAVASDDSFRGAELSSSAENMKRAVVGAATLLVATPHGWAVKAVAAASMVQSVRSCIIMIVRCWSVRDGYSGTGSLVAVYAEQITPRSQISE